LAKVKVPHGNLTELTVALATLGCTVAPAEPGPAMVMRSTAAVPPALAAISRRDRCCV